MSRYIDLELALNELLRLYEEDVDIYGVEIPETFDYHRAKETLQSLPTIEVVPTQTNASQRIESVESVERPNGKDRGMTNLDYIRTLSAEELADLLYDYWLPRGQYAWSSSKGGLVKVLGEKHYERDCDNRNATTVERTEE